MTENKSEKFLASIAKYKQAALDNQIIDRWRRSKDEHLNPLNKFGNKCYSQSDEDGITLEILRRLDINCSGFLELGVGDGTENNSLILLAMGWKGFWLGGEEILIDHEKSNRLNYYKEWITRDNVSDLVERGLDSLQGNRIEFLSIDLDGNDYYIAERLLEQGMQPALVIIEYNAKFIPPVEFKIDYDPQHRWRGNDYFGASLTSMQQLFEKHGYFLACCNSATGANAFFVLEEFRPLFPDVPLNIADIYAPPNYHLPSVYGFPVSIETINQLVK